MIYSLTHLLSLWTQLILLALAAINFPDKIPHCVNSRSTNNMRAARTSVTDKRHCTYYSPESLFRIIKGTLTSVAQLEHCGSGRSQVQFGPVCSLCNRLTTHLRIHSLFLRLLLDRNFKHTWASHYHPIPKLITNFHSHAFNFAPKATVEIDKVTWLQPTATGLLKASASTGCLPRRHEDTAPPQYNIGHWFLLY